MFHFPRFFSSLLFVLVQQTFLFIGKNPHVKTAARDLVLMNIHGKFVLREEERTIFVNIRVFLGSGDFRASGPPDRGKLFAALCCFLQPFWLITQRIKLYQFRKTGKCF